MAMCVCGGGLMGVREEAGAAERVRPSQVRVAPRRRVIRDRDRLLRDPPPPPPARPLPSHARQSHRRQAADRTAPILQRRLAKGRCAYRRVPRIGAPRYRRDREEMRQRSRRDDAETASAGPPHPRSTTLLLLEQITIYHALGLNAMWGPPPTEAWVAPTYIRLVTEASTSHRRSTARSLSARYVSLAHERGAGGPRRVSVRSTLLPVPPLLPPRQVSPSSSGLTSSSALDSTWRLHTAPSARQVGPMAAATSAPPPVGGSRAEGSQRG